MDSHDKIDHSEGGTTTVLQKFSDAGHNLGSGQYAVGENETFSAGYPGNLEQQILGLHIGYNSSPSHSAARYNPSYNAIGIDVRTGDLPGFPNAYFDAEEFSSTTNGPYTVGVAYEDLNSDGKYNIGEGRPGVVVTLTRIGSDGIPEDAFTATTGESGGYSIPSPPGTYIVTAQFQDSSPSPPVSVHVRSLNIKVDALIPAGTRIPKLVPYGQ